MGREKPRRNCSRGEKSKGEMSKGKCSSPVTPQLKNPELDADKLKNYRVQPDNICVQVGITSRRIIVVSSTNKMIRASVAVSIYRRFHSTETAILKVCCRTIGSQHVVGYCWDYWTSVQCLTA